MSRRWKCELWDCTSCNFISNVRLSDLRCEKAGAGLFCNVLLLGNRAKLICGYGGIGRRARFRFSCQQTCRFNSCYPHDIKRALGTYSPKGSFSSRRRRVEPEVPSPLRFGRCLTDVRRTSSTLLSALLKQVSWKNDSMRLVFYILEDCLPHLI